MTKDKAIERMQSICEQVEAAEMEEFGYELLQVLEAELLDESWHRWIDSIDRDSLLAAAIMETLEESS